jgi:hypothetical protein
MNERALVSLVELVPESTQRRWVKDLRLAVKCVL